MRNIIIFLFISFLIANKKLVAQVCPVVSFSYDQCGNRIKRTLQVTPCNLNPNARFIPTNDSIPDEPVIYAKVYPNPTAEYIIIEPELKEDAFLKTLTIIDLQGKVLLEKQFSSQVTKETIDVYSFKNGSYILQLYYSNKLKSSYTIIKN